MMYLLIACLAATAVAMPAEAANPVSVTVYYESLCPDSIKFYINQLFPTMEVTNISTNVDLQLIPYGKSTHMKADNGSWIFTCHHGERECYGNKVHACALKLMASKNERLTYLNCLLKSMLEDRKIVFPAEKCADELNIGEKVQIIQCANSTMADDLLAEMGNKTQKLQPPLKSVPTVVFNNKYDENDFKSAQTNFKGVLCKYISSPKPVECSGTSGSTSFSLSIFAMFATVLALASQFH